MSKVVRLLRSDLSPEQARGLLAISWPEPARIMAASIECVDGTEIRFSAPVGVELMRYLKAMANNASEGTPAIGKHE